MRIATSVLAGLLVGAVVDVHAQRLAVRNYSVAHGLAHNRVQAIHQDSRGYIWVATFEGLSRFDGYRFTNYGRREGLENTLINHVTEDRLKRLWVATNGAGVARLLNETAEHPADRTRFAIISIGDRLGANKVNRLLFDGENRLWCVTDDGLYRATSIEVRAGAFERVVEGTSPHAEEAAFIDRRGRLWFGINEQLAEVVGSTIVRHALPRGAEYPPPGNREVQAVIEDERGNVIAADGQALFTRDESTRTWRRLSLALDKQQSISALHLARSGGLLVGTSTGLIRFEDGQTPYSSAHRLSVASVTALRVDGEGNLWMGTPYGLDKLAGDMIATYTTANGLPHPGANQTYEDRRGRIYVTSGCTSALVEISGSRVTPVSQDLMEFACRALLFQDSRGNWWYRTKRRGLEYSVGPEWRPERGVAVTIDGRPGTAEVWTILEAADGTIWIGARDGLYAARFSTAATPRLRRAVDKPDIEFLVQDRTGTTWLGSRYSLSRVQGNQAVDVPVSEGLPSTDVRAFHLDGRGRLWIGLRYHGVSMTENPDSTPPRFVNYSTLNGLSSDTVWSIAEDAAGRIYLGTGKGLDRLDPDTGAIRTFTSEDGLAGSTTVHLLFSRSGHLWLASDSGVSRLDPRLERPPSPTPPVLITRLRVAGDVVPLDETGTTRPAALELQPTRNNLDVQFVAVRYGPNAPLHYQYKLEGVDDAWSAPTDQRELHFARVAPGRYRLLVRAVDSLSGTGGEPASLEFRVLAPFYLRGWFIAVAGVAILGLAYALYRYRLARFLEVAHMRTRIATDLHDDIGANLTKIAILSEVVRQQLQGDGDSGSPLAAIARISRESVSSMSDIVWAINPRRDTVLDLTRRMRQYAEELFAQSDTTLTFTAPASNQQHSRLGIELRRDLFLIFKEAVTNVARHAGCSRVDVELSIEDASLTLRVTDNGVGFEPNADADGEGLASMQRRAERLGGTLTLQSRLASGSTIVARVPVTAARRAARRRHDLPPQVGDSSGTLH
jgi:ligand-binding sensor domain-containing protein/two-component sensor histidine kinase